MVIKSRNLLNSLFIATMLIGLAACGGGGSSGGGSSTAASSIQVSGNLDGTTIQAANKSIFHRIYAMFMPQSANASIPTITSIVARSGDGTSITGTLSGNAFTLNLPKNKTYMIYLLDNTTTLATLQLSPSTGLSAVPINSSSSNISLGTVSLSGTTAVPSSSESSILGSIGLTSSQASSLATRLVSMTWLKNVDVDSDGIIDFKENRFYMFFVNYWLGQGYNFSVGGQGNTFKASLGGYTPPPTSTETAAGYSLSIQEELLSSSNYPTFNTTGIVASGGNGSNGSNTCLNVSILTPPSSITNHSDGENALNSNGTVNLCYSNPGLTFNGSTYRTFQFGNAGDLLTAPVTPPQGTYVMSDSSLNNNTLTFDNVQSISMTSLNNIYFLTVKLTESGGNITSAAWQWMKYDSGSSSWVNVTSDAEIQSAIFSSAISISDSTAKNQTRVALNMTASGSVNVPAQNFTPVRLIVSYIDWGMYLYDVGDW